MIKAGSVGRSGTSFLDFDDVPMNFEREEVNDVEWVEKGRNRISHIYISFDEIIRSIQFGYLENGALVLSTKYGPCVGQNFRAVRLNEDEFVTGLSGTLGLHGGIRNLTFQTNRRKLGPFGYDDLHASGPKIEIDPAIHDQREFVCFFGSYNQTCLSSIGFYVSPIAR